MSPWFYLAAIPIFTVVVLVHEFGHFITAKWFGIRVDEFGLGFPPRAIGIKRGETIYSLNWLPLGGFVRMPGENGEVTTADGVVDPRSFAAKPAGNRLIVLLAGVTMNILLAIVLFSVADAIGQVVNYQPIVGMVESNSPAAHAGIHTGDTLISVDGQPVKHWSDFVAEVSAVAGRAPANATTFPVTLVLVHSGSTEPVTLTINARAHPAQNQGHLGVAPDYKHAIIKRVPILQAPLHGVQDVGAVLGSIGDAVQKIIRGTLSPADAFQGPVGIVQTSGEVASTVPLVGPYLLLFLTGALSTSLALVNVLPIPALDGGRVLLILIEVARRGKRLSPDREALITVAGLAVLLSLMVVITFFDVSKIFSGR
jgi:regulator of sigma E protease